MTKTKHRNEKGPKFILEALNAAAVFLQIREITEGFIPALYIWFSRLSQTSLLESERKRERLAKVISKGENWKGKLSWVENAVTGTIFGRPAGTFAFAEFW